MADVGWLPSYTTKKRAVSYLITSRTFRTKALPWR